MSVGGRKLEVWSSCGETMVRIRAVVAGTPVADVPVDTSRWEQRLYKLLLTSVRYGLVQGRCCYWDSLLVNEIDDGGGTQGAGRRPVRGPEAERRMEHRFAG